MVTIFEWIWKFLLDLFISRKINGELTVAGSDQAMFELPERPNTVDVQFVDDSSCAPCDPGTDDELSWEVKKLCCDGTESKRCKCRKKWFLVIKWKVAGMRKIVWEVCS